MAQSPVLTEAQAVAVANVARRLLDRFGLRDWSFGFNRRKRSMGLCVFTRRTIELSMYFVARNSPEAIADTLLHEIAHALVGPGHGHDAVWKRQCLAIGAKPTRCSQADMPEGRWRAVCGACGRHFHRHRNPKRIAGWFCRPCGPERGRLTWRATSDSLESAPLDSTKENGTYGDQ